MVEILVSISSWSFLSLDINVPISLQTENNQFNIEGTSYKTLNQLNSIPEMECLSELVSDESTSKFTRSEFN